MELVSLIDENNAGKIGKGLEEQKKWRPGFYKGD